MIHVEDLPLLVESGSVSQRPPGGSDAKPLIGLEPNYRVDLDPHSVIPSQLLSAGGTCLIHGFTAPLLWVETRATSIEKSCHGGISNTTRSTSKLCSRCEAFWIEGPMATVAEFTLDSHEFPLGTVFAELPAVTVQLERVVPDANGVIPYFWFRGTETDTHGHGYVKTSGTSIRSSAERAASRRSSSVSNRRFPSS